MSNDETLQRRRSFAAELLVKSRHVVVPLGLVEVPGDRVSEVVLVSELGDMLLAASVAGTVGQPRFVER
jgi:hypothetical protein